MNSSLALKDDSMGIIYELLGAGIFILSAGIIYTVFFMALGLFYIRKGVAALERP